MRWFSLRRRRRSGRRGQGRANSFIEDNEDDEEEAEGITDGEGEDEDETYAGRFLFDDEYDAKEEYEEEEDDECKEEEEEAEIEVEAVPVEELLTNTEFDLETSNLAQLRLHLERARTLYWRKRLDLRRRLPVVDNEEAIEVFLQRQALEKLAEHIVRADERLEELELMEGDPRVVDPGDGEWLAGRSIFFREFMESYTGDEEGHGENGEDDEKEDAEDEDPWEVELNTSRTSQAGGEEERGDETTEEVEEEEGFLRWGEERVEETDWDQFRFEEEGKNEDEDYEEEVEVEKEGWGQWGRRGLSSLLRWTTQSGIELEKPEECGRRALNSFFSRTQQASGLEERGYNAAEEVEEVEGDKKDKEEEEWGGWEVEWDAQSEGEETNGEGSGGVMRLDEDGFEYGLEETGASERGEQEDGFDDERVGRSEDLEVYGDEAEVEELDTSGHEEEEGRLDQAERGRTGSSVGSRLGAAFMGVGQETGLVVWRFEAEKDPSEGFLKVDETRHGEVFTGECYLILNTYTSGSSSTMSHDIRYWLGSEAAMEKKVAVAGQATRLRDQLQGTVFKEVENEESNEFLRYFKCIKYLNGAFKQIDPLEHMYKKLYRVTQKQKSACLYEEEATVTKLQNSESVFILDLGRKVYLWYGEESPPKERFIAATVASNFVLERSSAATLLHDHDDLFWGSLGARRE